MERDRLREQIAELVAAASDGAVRPDDALDGRLPLTSVGLTSLGFVRLVDAVESRYGVDLVADGDLLDLETVDGVVDRIMAAPDARWSDSGGR
jgi:acyl carrier protein